MFQDDTLYKLTYLLTRQDGNCNYHRQNVTVTPYGHTIASYEILSASACV